MKCLDCIRHLPACPRHKREMQEKEESQRVAIREAVQGWKTAEISRICLRFELESDERSTREEKAARYL